MALILNPNTSWNINLYYLSSWTLYYVFMNHHMRTDGLALDPVDKSVEPTILVWKVESLSPIRIKPMTYKDDTCRHV